MQSFIPPTNQNHLTGLGSRSLKLLSPVMDFALALFAFCFVYLLRFYPESLWREPLQTILRALYQPNFRDHLGIAVATSLFLVTFAYKSGLYALSRSPWFLKEFAGLFSVLFWTTIFGTVLSFVFERFVISRAVLFGFILLLFPLLIGWRLARSRLFRYTLVRDGRARRVLVVGAGKVGRYLASFLKDNPSLGAEVLGFLDDNSVGPNSNHKKHNGLPVPVLGRLEDCETLARQHRVDGVYITIPSERSKIAGLVEAAGEHGIAVYVVPDLFDLSVRQVAVENLGSLPILHLFRASFSPWERLLKRTGDIVVSSLLLLIFGPLMAMIALAIKLQDGGPVIFRQERHGFLGVPFFLLKFRSMRCGAGDSKHRAAAEKWLMGDGPIDEERGLYKIVKDDRVTHVGRIIRKFSLDELPQLWNVLRGEMSLVGPRPPLPYEYAQYEIYQKKRLLIRPGITGLWQVSGWHKLSFDEMVVLDLRYINEWSSWLDLWIIGKTVPIILFGRGT